MFGFIGQLADIITAVIGAVLHFFEMLIYLVVLVIKMVGYIPTMVNFLPTFVGSFVLLTLLLSVLLYRILNRE